jgi:NADP-dependent 3-hydroxy acid dehydrogenase YdfG
MKLDDQAASATFAPASGSVRRIALISDAELRPHGIRVTAVVAGGMRTPFLLDRFPDLDPGLLQDPADVAQAILCALQLPRSSVVPELTVLPVRETSWP